MQDNRVKIEISRAQTRDIEILIQYRIKYFEATDRELTGHEKEVLAAGLRDYFLRSMPTGEYISFIARIGGCIAGIGGMTVHELPGNPDNPLNKTGYILNMFTEPEFRGRGVCTAILDSLANEGRSLGLSRLDLRATEDGYPVYIRYGFKEPQCRSLNYIL